MRKKLLTVALAATMVVSSVFSAFAEDVDCTGWWAAHSSAVEITTDEVEITFHSQTYDSATSNWNTPIYVVYAADEKFAGGSGLSDTAGYTEYFVMRSDAYGWTPSTNTNDDSSLAVFEGTPADDDAWATWLAANKTGVDCTVTAKKTADDTVTVTLTNNGVTSTATITVDSGKTIYISIGGELNTITNLTSTTSGSTTSTTETTAEAATDDSTSTTEEATTAAVTTVPGTADTAAVAVIAVVALGAAVAVVASKKKVTE